LTKELAFNLFLTILLDRGTPPSPFAIKLIKKYRSAIDLAKFYLTEIGCKITF
jgi:hypothetical protein